MTVDPREFPRLAARVPELRCVPHAGSTNAELLARIAAEPDAVAHGAVLMTFDQRAGRGRLDRQWQAPPDTMAAVSVALRLPVLDERVLGWLALLAGTALVGAIRAETGVPAAVKWPNDILVGDRKLVGILGELAVVEGQAFVVLGSGINVSLTPEQLPVPTATSLLIEAGAPVDLDAILANYVGELLDRVDILTSVGPGEDCAGFLPEILAVCQSIGQRVRVELPGGAQVFGRARALDRDGRIVVDREDGGVLAVTAGDVVHLRAVS